MDNNQDKKFGQLRLSAKGTNNGRGFDILYDFGKSHNFLEFTSKNEFYFIQPWMQFPADEYTDECMRVSIELVKRFNQFENLIPTIERQRADIKWMKDQLDKKDNLIFELRDLLNKAKGNI